MMSIIRFSQGRERGRGRTERERGDREREEGGETGRHIDRER